MPLQQLVEYFNQRFEHELQTPIRHFIHEDSQVIGLFGPIRISSTFTPLRQTLDPLKIVGYSANILVAAQSEYPLYRNEIETLLKHSTSPSNSLESIIHFDRLARTVHMLNYLTLTNLYQTLFLEVNPRHVLGVKKDHGAYFESVISRCGLETKNVVIALSIDSGYGQYSNELAIGLENYRQHGYQIALKINHIGLENSTTELIKSISPDYLCLSALNIKQYWQDSGLKKLPNKDLHYLKTIATSIGAKSILQQIDHQESATLAGSMGFEFVQGNYYEQEHVLPLVDPRASVLKKTLSLTETP